MKRASNDNNNVKNGGDALLSDLSEGQTQMMEPIDIDYPMAYPQASPENATAESDEQQLQEMQDSAEPIPVNVQHRSVPQQAGGNEKEEHRQRGLNAGRNSNQSVYTTQLPVDFSIERQRPQQYSQTMAMSNHQRRPQQLPAREDDTEPLPVNLPPPHQRPRQQMPHPEQHPQQPIFLQDVEPIQYPPTQQPQGAVDGSLENSQYYLLPPLQQQMQQPHRGSQEMQSQERYHFLDYPQREQNQKATHRRHNDSSRPQYSQELGAPRDPLTGQQRREDSEPLVHTRIEPQPWRPEGMHEPMQYSAQDWLESMNARQSNSRVSTPAPLPTSPSPSPNDNEPLSPQGMTQQIEPPNNGQRVPIQADPLAYTNHGEHFQQAKGDRLPLASKAFYPSQQHLQQYQYFQSYPQQEQNTLYPPDSTTTMNDLNMDPIMAEHNTLEKQQRIPQQKLSQTEPLSSSKRSAKVTIAMIRADRKAQESEAWVDNYLLRVHDMLEDAESKHFSDVISWQSHGRAYKIHKPEKFYNDVMPRYFDCKKASFHRWLRGWGFVRLIEGPDRGAYFHRYFARGLMALIKSKTRSQMCGAMENWCNARPRLGLPSVNTKRKGDVAIDSGTEKLKKGCSVVLKNGDKVLRGKILHEVREMLRMAEVDNFTDIVSWSRNGTSFKIHKREPFKEEVMNRFMTCSKLSYFSDLLRSWGFCRLKEAKGEENNAYFHLLFQRDKPELCRSLTKEQMFASMKQYREEQKRMKDPGPAAIGDEYKDDEKERKDTLKAVLGIDQNEEVFCRILDGDAGSSSAFEAASLSLHDDTASVSLGTDLRILKRNDPKAEHSAKSLLFFSQRQPNGIDPINCLGTYPAGYFFDPTSKSCDNATKSNSDYAVPMKGASEASASNFDSDFDSKRKAKTYLRSIETMLEDAESNAFASIVSWQPHGRSFKVYDAQQFERKILPRYFNGKLHSFNRHLLAWGFLRLTAGKDRGAWYHRYFVRGATDLIRDFSRQEMLDAMTKWIAPGKEPDFYTCGKGSALSEKLKRSNTDSESINTNANEEAQQENHNASQEQVEDCDPGDVERDDPKKLRGSMIEDIREMLEVVRKEKKDTIVSWLVHGKAFKVHQKDQFIKVVLPRFSKCTKFQNFADALRAWGFVRLKKNRDKGAFFHKLFQKDEPRLTLHLSRKQMKDAMSYWKSLNGDEPDLYDGIGEDILFASEQMHALRGKTKRKRSKSPTKDARKRPRGDSATAANSSTKDGPTTGADPTAV